MVEIMYAIAIGLGLLLDVLSVPPSLSSWTESPAPSLVVPAAEDVRPGQCGALLLPPLPGAPGPAQVRFVSCGGLGGTRLGPSVWFEDRLVP